MIMKNIFRSISIITAAVLILLSVSCSAPITDDEAREILGDLVPKSQELNAIFWSDALPLEDKEAAPVKSVTAAQYYEVSSESKYQTVEQLKQAAEEVFSSDYLSDLYPILFDGFSETDAEGSEYNTQPRYTNSKNGILARDISSFTLEFTTKIDTTNAHVVKSGSDIVRVEVDAEINGEETTMDITLRYQNGKWLIDSPTY